MNFSRCLGFICFIISIYILWQIQQLLLLIFTAIVFATALNRLIRWLEQHQIKRNYAITLTFTGILILITLFFVLIIPPFLEQFKNLLELSPQIWQQIRHLLITLRDANLGWLPQPPTTLSDLVKQLQPIFEDTQFWKRFFAIFSNSFFAILQLLFILILIFVMLLNPHPYRQGFLRLFPSFYRRRGEEILDKTELALVNWFTGIVISSTFIGVFSAIGLFALHINLVLFNALLAGLLNFIPNIGPTTSVVFPIMLALLDAPWKVGAVLILYFIIQNIESYLLTPTVMAKQVSLLPAVTLMAQLFFAKLFGVLGLLLALPLTVVAKTWIEEVLFKDILDQWHITTPCDVE
ncbi:AI-2E family transporter [Gloeothece verrucosa]|uniref:Permease n=1 Tax=Gloeothece verrucosa (strain PCC 7822) TaxID=497965 RepID=E0U787_GLOV7|nr:AI-2E family transporter [Gloeothece verrucosa]ADN12474.1 protein of unknown function UPF0118 [Gloeothece verrucosa PCC 7822]